MVIEMVTLFDINYQKIQDHDLVLKTRPTFGLLNVTKTNVNSIWFV